MHDSSRSSRVGTGRVQAKERRAGDRSPGQRARRTLLHVAIWAVVAFGVPSLGALGLAHGLALPGAGNERQAAASAGSSFYPPCLNCHEDPDLKMDFPNGESVSLYFDPAVFQKSVHATQVGCVDCHPRAINYPHGPLKVSSLREFKVAEYQVCKRCHFDNYTRTLDSTHYEALAKGNEKAPVCTDCHGSHDIAASKGAKVDIGHTCANCHADIYAAYSKSVHGSAMLQANADVPVCTDCHGVHNIAQADTSSFRQASVDLCIKCHGDKSLMAKYGISADVTKTYLDDFHGKTVGFYQEQSSRVWPDVAVCTDCHGVHDIAKVDSPDSPVVKANIQKTCQRCHTGAAASFPAAWLSHYQPSMDKHPLVYLIQQYYKVLIPLMVVGLMLNVGLDLWRLARNR